MSTIGNEHPSGSDPMGNPSGQDDTREVEIYLRADPGPILAWVASLCVHPATLAVRARGGMVTRRGDLSLRLPDGDAAACEALLVESAANGFSSLCFTGHALPWANDLDCARAAASAIGCEVRCNAEAWQPGDDEDDGWIAITRDGEQAIRWRSA
jgi:hypothetical protein